MYKALLLVCALALSVQCIAARCIGAGLAGPWGAYDGFGPYDGFGLYDGIGPYGAFDGYGAYGYGGYGYGIGPFAGPFRAGCGYGPFI